MEKLGGKGVGLHLVRFLQAFFWDMRMSQLMLFDVDSSFASFLWTVSIASPLVFIEWLFGFCFFGL